MSATGVSCGVGKYCGTSDAGAACLDQVCQPGVPSCQENAAIVCNATGSGFVGNGTDCGDDVCIAGNCEPVVCAASSAWCEGDDVVTCNETGTLAEVTQTCPPGDCAGAACAPDLLAWWAFDEGSGIVAADGSGNGHNGELIGTTFTDGYAGTALEGANGGYMTAFDTLNDLALPVTVSMWLHRGANTSTSLLQTDASADHYYGIGWAVTSNGIEIKYGDGGGKSASGRRSKSSSVVLPIGQWLHIAAVVAGPTDMQIYLNGIDIGGAYSGSGGPMLQSADPWNMGNTLESKSRLDDVRIYGRALAPEEVQAMVGDGCPVDGAGCFDSDPCTVGDTCSAGSCSGGGWAALPIDAWDASPVPGEACDAQNALQDDGQVAGMDRSSGSVSTLIDGASVTGCVATDFGAIQRFDAIHFRAARIDQACHTPCGPSATPGAKCGGDPGTRVYTSADGATWDHRSSLKVKGAAVKGYTVTVHDDARYVMVYRGGGSGNRDDITLDVVESVAKVCGSTIPWCGDGEVNTSGELCDDGNLDPCDGCESCTPRRNLSTTGEPGSLVEISDADSSLELIQTDLTVEFWFGPSDDPLLGQLTRRGAGNSGWSVIATPTYIRGTVYDVGDHTVSVDLSGGEWHHVAWTWDQATSSLWLDGVLVGTKAEIGQMKSTGAPIRIGALSDANGVVTHWRSVLMDEARVSTTVRYTETFDPPRDLGADAETVGLWHFDEDGSVVDSSDHDHSATASAISWPADTGYGGLYCE